MANGVDTHWTNDMNTHANTLLLGMAAMLTGSFATAEISHLYTSDAADE